MDNNKRPETMERITTPELAQKCIDEQVAAVREQVKDGKVLLNNADIVPVTVSSGLQQPVTDFETRLAKAFPDALVVDALSIAEQQVGNARTMNMVIAGALSTLAPFKRSAWLKAMAESFTGRKAKLLEINEKAFALGRAAVPGFAEDAS